MKNNEQQNERGKSNEWTKNKNDEAKRNKNKQGNKQTKMEIKTRNT